MYDTKCQGLTLRPSTTKKFFNLCEECDTACLQHFVHDPFANTASLQLRM